MGILIDFLLMRDIFNASINKIDKVNERLQLLEKLTRQAKASDVAKSQVHFSSGIFFEWFFSH